MTGLDIDSGGVRISRWLLGILVTVLVTAWGGAACSNLTVLAQIAQPFGLGFGIICGLVY